MKKSIDYPEGNVKKIDLVYMAGALASVVKLAIRYDQTKYGRLRFDRIINNESNLK